jgi:hypothetical protein
MYDTLKWIALILLPALAVFVTGLNAYWDIPNQDAIAGTIILVDTLLGALLQISSNKQESFDGYLATEGVNEVTGHPNLKMVVTKDPATIAQGKFARLKIGSPPAA